MAGNFTYTIGGVRVVFPCKPYPSQMSMMDKVGGAGGGFNSLSSGRFEGNFRSMIFKLILRDW